MYILCIFLNNSIVTLSPDTSISSSINLNKNSTPEDLVISEDGFYRLYSANNGTESTIKIALYNKNNEILFDSFYVSAPEFYEVTSQIFHLKAGTYKYRAQGQEIRLIKYNL